MTRTTWNYRMVQRNEAIGIYSVYYDEQGRIEGISEDPQKVIGYSIEGLNETLEWMEECTKNHCYFGRMLQEKTNSQKFMTHMT